LILALVGPHYLGVSKDRLCVKMIELVRKKSFMGGEILLNGIRKLKLPRLKVNGSLFPQEVTTLGKTITPASKPPTVKECLKVIARDSPSLSMLKSGSRS